MSVGHHHAWLPPGHLRPPDERHDTPPFANGVSRAHSRPRTPLRSRLGTDGAQAANLISDNDAASEEDPRIALFRSQYQLSQAKISALFGSGSLAGSADNAVAVAAGDNADADAPASEDQAAQPPAPTRRPARKIDDDDYDEYDDEEEEEEEENAAPAAPSSTSPVKSKPDLPRSQPSQPKPLPSPPQRPPISHTQSSDSSKDAKKESLEDIRKKLEEDKKATEEAARRSFHTMFYTLENDRDAMLDQKRLEESERQVEAEMSNQGNNTSNAAGGSTTGYGTLSTTNLGASSLTLKNLIARIDMKRSEVQASDAELRSLMSEVRKNRSKWASEDKIGQEELYESAEKVLSELKAMTEHSSAFLTRVNKREAPDYYNVIKRPMDLGTMTKKLKAVQYKSKQEFVEDLNLIWANCLKYNATPEHYLRKHALFMRKETEKLVPLIPDIVIRDRAEVEAEERRQQLAELDGAEESDDEPIMSSRGRKAPGKKAKKGAGTGRKAPGSGSEATPAAESNPQGAAMVRTDSEAAVEGSQNGLSTPPPGTSTPLGSVGLGTGAAGSQGDAMDIDGLAPLGEGALGTVSRPMIESEDPEYSIWKQVTKKDRALLAAERHRLFKGDKLNVDEPALIRTKAGMRRWLKNQKHASGEGDDKLASSGTEAKEPETAKETLAEGIEEEEDHILPDYYDTMSGIPDLPEKLHWVEDSEGNVVDTSEEYLRVLPKGSFTAPDSKFGRKMEANLRQMQETRKICSKIGIVKQMQLQSQMYQNQFQKYQPEPFIEHDVPTHVMNDAGPVISPWVCKAALQRSVGKLFYNTGFEEFQPSALDAATDIAADFFYKIGATLKAYMEAPKVPATEQSAASSETATSEWKSPHTPEEMILHTLSSVGLDIESLDAYVKDDTDRLGQKLTVTHDRMKMHYAELLRPAFNDGGGDGSNAFNDGSEQFVGGDFAEDIDEDFFGFKELGLDKEFGMVNLSVPLHLLQNKMYNAHQTQNAGASQASSVLFPTPPPYPRLSLQSVPQQIGLVQNFFLAKLHANQDEPLVEDLELPPKQRPLAGRTRLPASGKIPAQAPGGSGTSPQKRPLQPPSGTAGGRPSISEPSKKKVKKNNGTSFSADQVNGDDTAASSANGAKGAIEFKVPSKPNSNAQSTSSDKKDADADAELPNNLHNKMNGAGNATMNGAEQLDMTADASSPPGSAAGGMISPESINVQG